MQKLLSIKEVKKTQTSKLILEHHASRIVFSPDSITRKAVVYNLYWQQREHIPCHVLLEFLEWTYKNHSLEFPRGKSRINTGSSIIVPGVFRGRAASIKILKVTSAENTGQDNDESGKIRNRMKQKFVTEAFYLRQLSPHENLPSLLAYDTQNLPFHIVTEHAVRGNLLDFLRGLRNEASGVPSHIDLIQMCLDITSALHHLESHNIVHRAVMARNVLVGKHFSCKLSSLDFARPLDKRNDSYSYVSGDEFRKFIPQEAVEEELAVRWLAPECLRDVPQFTTASDVWASAVTMYEILTLGCEPYSRTRECRSLESDLGVVDYVSLWHFRRMHSARSRLL